jgi:hypothetical protein
MGGSMTKGGGETPSLDRTRRIRRLLSARRPRKVGRVCPAVRIAREDDEQSLLGDGHVAVENHFKTAPPYLCVVGYSWAVALAWKRSFPSEPFLGIRVDPEEVWVVFEPEAVAGPIPRSVFEQIAQAFEHTGTASISDNVFFYEASSLGAAHRLARRVATILQSGDYRRPPTRPLVTMSPSPRGHRLPLALYPAGPIRLKLAPVFGHSLPSHGMSLTSTTSCRRVDQFGNQTGCDLGACCQGMALPR